MNINQMLVIATNEEKDGFETGTYVDRPGATLYGSSWCRSKTPISKVKSSLITNEEFQKKNDKTSLSTDTDEIGSSKTEPKKASKMSDRTKSKIRQKILAWERIPRMVKNHKFSFITVTLTSPQIGDTLAYSKLLNTLFAYMRKYYRLNHYLYVNEIQTQSTGNLHSHIICDIPFIPVNELNNEWCRILQRAGYKASSQPGAKWEQFKQDTWVVTKRGTKRLMKKGDYKQNPLSIENVRDQKLISHYVTKYVTKNESSFVGTKWNNSDSVARLFTGVKIFQKSVFYSLYEAFEREYTVKIDDRHSLHIHLLSRYTDIQHQHFKINKDVLSGDLSRETYIAKLQAKQYAN